MRAWAHCPRTPTNAKCGQPASHRGVNPSGLQRIPLPGYRPAVAVAAEEEQVIWTGRPSWRGRLAILVPGVLLTIIALVVCVWADLSATVSVVVAGIVALVTVVWAFIETLRWKYTITNRRVFVRKPKAARIRMRPLQPLRADVDIAEAWTVQNRRLLAD